MHSARHRFPHVVPGLSARRPAPTGCRAVERPVHCWQLHPRGPGWTGGPAGLFSTSKRWSWNRIGGSVGIAAMHGRSAAAERRVARLEGVLHPVLTHRRLEGHRFGGEVPARVDLRTDALQRAGAHQLQPEVHHALVGGQLSRPTRRRGPARPPPSRQQPVPVPRPTASPTLPSPLRWRSS